MDPRTRDDVSGLLSHPQKPFSPPNLDLLLTVAESSSLVEKMWTVPWSLDTHSRAESWLKLMLQENRGGANSTDVRRGSGS